ncbi:hypothetical protein IAI10_20220 [Clostridium sp. 19966]|uniref:hypothetical protein n=1 Tax=Clostridium sp. 19966 TaxID=2768166 RepID=UPI0028DF745F|nr:hypothetical protein [Clostridium sp. 19966]MDT8718983.1 hypothetical protein [Clostridium sp. 19966]
MANIKAKDLKKASFETFKLGNKEYKIDIDFNVFSEMEEIYGDDANMPKILDDLANTKVKAIRALIYGIVRQEDENITLKQVGKMMNKEFLNDIVGKLGKALFDTMPEKKDDETENLGE